MAAMDYAELDWRGTILLAAALRRGLLGAVAGGFRPAAEVARELGLDERVVRRELDVIAHSFGYGDLALDERRLKTALTALRSGLVDRGD